MFHVIYFISILKSTSTFSDKKLEVSLKYVTSKNVQNILGWGEATALQDMQLVIEG